MICPMCHGAQSFAGERRRTGRHGLYVEEIDCEECNGTGKVEDDYHERREECRRVDLEMMEQE